MEAHPDGPTSSGAATAIDGIERSLAEGRRALRRVNSQAKCLPRCLRRGQVGPAHSAVATDHAPGRVGAKLRGDITLIDTAIAARTLLG